MKFPLSKNEMNYIRDIKSMFNFRKHIRPTNEQALIWQDVLNLMIERGFLRELSYVGGNDYYLLGNIEIFENWVVYENKKANKITKREWCIMIASTVVSAILTTILNNILHIINWFKG